MQRTDKTSSTPSGSAPRGATPRASDSHTAAHPNPKQPSNFVSGSDELVGLV